MVKTYLPNLRNKICSDKGIMKILESFKARVFFLTTALVLITALSISSIFQQIQIEKHTVDLELQNARSMLHLLLPRDRKPV